MIGSMRCKDSLVSVDESEMWRFFSVSAPLDNKNETDRMGGVSWREINGGMVSPEDAGAGDSTEECIEPVP